MKIQSANKGFSALDLMIVIAVIVVLAGFLLPSFKNKPRAWQITCLNNLRSLGIGFRLYANDGAPYPTYDETKEGWQYFQTVGIEIGSPKVLLCPADVSKSRAAWDFAVPATSNSFSNPTFQNNSLSYFYGADSSEHKGGIFLLGDRSISTNSTIISGMLAIETTTKVEWANGIHKEVGNIAFADGSAQTVTTPKLLAVVRTGTNGTQRLLIP